MGSHSISSEMHTGNAYIIQDHQQADVILPVNGLKESFTVYIADNIDRKDETLSGTRSGAEPEVLKKEGRGLQDLQIG